MTGALYHFLLTPPPCSWCGASDGCDCAARIACAQAGRFGHLSCGWCAVHDQPAFRCACSVRTFNEQVRAYEQGRRH